MTDNRLNAERGQPMLFALPLLGRRDSCDAPRLLEPLQVLLAQRDALPAVALGRHQQSHSPHRALDAQLL
jgi:hypothetical protein